jgi:hypothetical protein
MINVGYDAEISSHSHEASNEKSVPRYEETDFPALRFTRIYVFGPRVATLLFGEVIRIIT